jgi:hypothetical protein
MCGGVQIYDVRQNTKIKVIRRIFGFKREVTINRRKIHSGEFKLRYFFWELRPNAGHGFLIHEVF